MTNLETVIKNTIYQVCIPHTSRDYFDYYHESDALYIGARVLVSFRKQTRIGLIIGKQQETMHSALKSINEVIDTEAILPESMLSLCRWVAKYYQSPLSEIIPLALPKLIRLGGKSQLPLGECYRLTTDIHLAHTRLSPRAHKQHELVDLLHQSADGVSRKVILQQGFTQAQLNQLLQQNMIEKHEQIILPYLPKGALNKPLSLNEEQDLAVRAITAQLHHYYCFLLHGITGSGKTEVYLQIIDKLLAEDKQILVLVPEIGLTPQLLARFTDRFAEPIVVIHSNLNETERQSAWQLAKDNIAKLVIGTRTAIFTPMPQLGLIIIDEEHDASLKQMEGVRYSARDTALMRAYMENIPIVLGSATPSLESLYNCQQDKYGLLRLNQRALNKTPLHYRLIDIRSCSLQEGLAPQTLAIMAEHLNQNNQVMLFINRRGFAPVLLCHHCGWMADCQACDSHLTLHRKSNRLICHHCGLGTAIPWQCKSCQNKELLPIGTGTQRVHEYLSRHFPDVPLLRIDRDEVKQKNALHHHLERINRGEVQLIVGTQMLAKGHHFPRLTLVVVLDADAGFYNQDFRALERLGQLLIQVSGRAGRAESSGQVLIQTHLPQHPLLNLLVQQGYDPFAKALLNAREQTQLPPYQFLALIRAQDKSAPKVLNFLHLIREQLLLQGLTILGPAPAPLAKKANQQRMQLLIKSVSRKQLQTRLTQLREWLTINKLATQVRWNIDIDPMDLS